MPTPRISLKDLQAAPHHIKLRWVVALSLAAFIVIIAVWLLALPSMVALAPPTLDENPAPAPQTTGIASIFDIFNRTNK